MNLVFTTACCYPDTEPIHMLLDSCRRFDIDIRCFGVGSPSCDWIEIKITRMLAALKDFRAQGFSHVLYTDGRDSLFAANRQIIERQYLLAGAPKCLISAERSCYPYRDLGTRFTLSPNGYSYPCAGQFMGYIPWIIERWERLRADYAADSEGNDQAWICKGFVDGVLDGMKIDSDQLVFQSMDDEAGDIRGCVLHFNGGYVDPVTGRDERMLPWWYRILERKLI